MSDSEDNIRRQLIAAFGHDDVYAILGVSKTATASEIKKGYMKLALVHHPDKGGDKEKFQALSLAHSILSDEDKRKLYDSNGSLDDSSDFNQENFDFWYQYFRNLFPQISLDDISRFEQEYIGSAEEKRDIVAAYEQHKGQLQHIMDSVMFAEEGHELRVIEVIDNSISAGEIRSTKAYERAKAQALADASDARKVNQKKRKQAAHAASQEEALTALIQARQQNRQRQASAFADILSKYEQQAEDDEDAARGKNKRHKKSKSSSSSSADAADIDEDEFRRIQDSLSKQKSKKH